MKKTLRAIVLIMAGLLVLTALTSCGKSAEKIKEKAEEAGYTCVSADAETLKMINEKQGVAAVSALTITNDKGEIAIVYEFEKAKDAKTVEGELEDTLKKLGALTDSKTIERSGKTVIYGDVAIVDVVW